MSAHCKDSLKHPDQGHLSSLILEAEVNSCVVKVGKTSRHTTTIDNQRPGNIYQVDICVKSKHGGVILNNDPTATEYKRMIPVLRSGKKHADRFPVDVNAGNPMPNDEIATAIVLYDSTEIMGSSYGASEQASLEFTIDIS